MSFFRYYIAVPAIALGLFTLYGCANPSITNTKRSAIEELVISTAADRSIAQLSEVHLDGKKVFVDFTNLTSTDAAYVKGCVRQRIGSYGALLMDDKKSAELVVEVFCGALDTNFENFLLGVPPVAIPVPFSGSLETPEVAFYKRDAQSAVCKLGFTVIEKSTGKVLKYQENLIGASYYNRYAIIGISWHNTDIPKDNKYDN